MRCWVTESLFNDEDFLGRLLKHFETPGARGNKKQAS
jgi:hypothetical protein